MFRIEIIQMTRTVVIIVTTIMPIIRSIPPSISSLYHHILFTPNTNLKTTLLTQKETKKVIESVSYRHPAHHQVPKSRSNSKSCAFAILTCQLQSPVYDALILKSYMLFLSSTVLTWRSNLKLVSFCQSSWFDIWLNFVVQLLQTVLVSGTLIVTRRSTTNESKKYNLKPKIFPPV